MKRFFITFLISFCFITICGCECECEKTRKQAFDRLEFEAYKAGILDIEIDKPEK